MIAFTFPLFIALGFPVWMLAVLARADDRAQPRSDHFGDPLPAGAVARLGTVRLRHADSLNSIRFAPDGKTLISLGHDGVHVWDAATGKPVRHFGAGASPWSIDLSADGRLVALRRSHAGVGSLLELWEVATGKLIHKLSSRDYSLVRFSPDGKQLAVLTGEFSPGGTSTPWSITLWDTETGRDIRTLTGPKEYIWDMIFSSDGKTLLLAGSDKAISLCSTADGNEVRRLRDLPANAHTLALSPRGDRIAFIESWLKESRKGTSWGANVRVFLVDARTGAELRRWSVKPTYSRDGILQNGWWSVAFSPDGRRLAACQQHGPVYIWDTKTGEENRLAPEGRQHSGGVAFSPDGKTLAVGEGGRSIRLIDAATGANRLPVQGHRGGVTALAVSEDGKSIFTADEVGTIYRWEARSGRELGRLTGHQDEVNGLALTADGRLLYSAGRDKTLRLWDLTTGKARRLLAIEPFYWIHLTLSPDGKSLAVPVNSKDLLLLNAATGECRRRLTATTRIIDAAFSADASVVKTATGALTVCRWEAATGRRLSDELVPPEPHNPPNSPDQWWCGERIVFSRDGRLAAYALDDDFLRVLDVASRQELYRKIDLPSNVAALAFAADGRTLAWGEGSGVIHWLELASGGERRTLRGHTGMISQLDFSTDGKRLVSASGDTTALVWDLIGQRPASLSAMERDACWLDLADKDAAKAYRAMCHLIAAPAEAVALLRPHLEPVKEVDERRMERWITDLDADAFAVRDKATEELHKLGELAEPALRKTMSSRPSLELRRRVQGLLDDLAQHRWHATSELLRQLRAVEVLERLGTPEARKLLESLAGGASGARLTREARGTVQRLSNDFRYSSRMKP